MSRTFVITGGAKGIGRCMVEYFASKGDKVYFIDNDAKTTIVVGNQLRGKGWDVHDFVGDIADKKTLIDFAAKVFQENPDGVHCLINNACLMRGGILKGCDYEDFLYIQQVGVFLPSFYANGYKVGVAFVKAIIPTTLAMIVFEALPHVPGLMWLDDMDAATQVRLLPYFVAAVLLYGIGTVLTFRRAAAQYEKVDL